MTPGSVGYDLTAAENHVIRNVQIAAEKVHTGIAVEIPNGYHGQIYLRSSIGAKTKLRLANGTGIIDSDYRGELILLFENVGNYPEVIKKGDRVAQLVIEPNTILPVSEVKELSETQRNDGAFGSTDNKKKDTKNKKEIKN